MRKQVALALALALGVAGSASAQGPSPHAAGIAKARAAGIAVDPAAENAMAAAPVGSCLNNPTQAKCDRPTRIVSDDEPVGPNDAVLTAPATSTTTAAQTRAVDGGISTVCLLHANDPQGPVLATAQGHSYMYCISNAGVTHMEFYVTLFMFWTSTSSWHQAGVTRSYSGPPAGTVGRTASANCNRSGYRYWMNQTVGYIVRYSVWYATSVLQPVANLYCIN